MKGKLLVVLILAAGTLVVADPIFAHHAGSDYDSEHPVTLTGIVTSFELVNPHSRILFVVKDEKGVETQWTGVAGAVMRMVRVNGWKKDTLKPGDKITVTGPPAKDGKKEVRLSSVVMPDGSTRKTGAE